MDKWLEQHIEKELNPSKLDRVLEKGWIELIDEQVYKIYGKMDRRLIYYTEDDSIIRIWKDEGFGGCTYIIKPSGIKK